MSRTEATASAMNERSPMLNNGLTAEQLERLPLLPLLGLAWHESGVVIPEELVRKNLQEVGIATAHWQIIRQLNIYCNAHIAELLAIPLQRPKILRAIDLLSQSDLSQESLAKLEVADLRNLRKMGEAVPGTHDDKSLAKLAKGLVADYSFKKTENQLLPEIMQWWAEKPERKIIRTWQRLKTAYFLSKTWSLPVSIPERVDTVMIEPLTNGKKLRAEGKRMGNCLKDRLDKYVHFALLDLSRFFHLYDEKHPLICATLSIDWDSQKESWNLGEFETVGRGKPQERFYLAAKTIIEIFNAKVPLHDPE